MPEHLVLIAPAANRVYAAVAPALARSEATVVLTGLLGDGVRAEQTELAGVPYLRVLTERPHDRLVAALSNLSVTYALFVPEGGLLRPVPLQRLDRHPSDLVTVQKYKGKTNEQWTRLCLNVTAAATARPARWLDHLQVLDPMCGRGTTLNLALLLGYDVVGVDVDRKDYQGYTSFLKTWLRGHRYKHELTEQAVRTGGTHRGRRLQVNLAPDKEQFKAGRVQKLTYLSTDTTDLDGLLPARSADVIVTDTPYGVQHGAHGAGLSRSPLEVLDRAMPGWVRLLRTGGAVGLSYNRHVTPPDRLADLLTRHGLQVAGGPGFDGLRHRVDASIDRDLMVARRP